MSATKGKEVKLTDGEVEEQVNQLCCIRYEQSSLQESLADGCRWESLSSSSSDPAVRHASLGP
jgi:hypothetical protein